jgi:hypothetical protein
MSRALVERAVSSVVEVFPVAVAFTGKADMPLIVPVGRE